MNDYLLTIIVPIYNESEAIPRLIKELNEYLQFSPVKSKILFVDDGSTDGSDKIIRDYCRTHKHFDYKFLKSNFGLSTALKVGFDSIDTPFTGYLDADLQTNPKDFILFFEYMKNYDLINGVRISRDDSLLRKWSSKVANYFRRLMVKDGIRDTCCPLKIIHTRMAKRIPFFKGMHRFIPALVMMEGGNVKEVEIRHFARVEGKAKYNIRNRVFASLVDTFGFLWIKNRRISYQIDEEYP